MFNLKILEIPFSPNYSFMNAMSLFLTLCALNKQGNCKLTD